MNIHAALCTLLLLGSAGLSPVGAQTRPGRPMVGTVVSRTGQPVAGASLWPRDHPANLVVTNADGAFLLPSPQPAAYCLRVEAAGFVRLDRLVTDTTAQPLRLVLYSTTPSRPHR